LRFAFHTITFLKKFAKTVYNPRKLCYNIGAKQISYAFPKGYFAFFQRGELYLLSSYKNKPSEFDKSADSFGFVCMAKYPSECLKFVWRQLESAFFGALTSVGALFYFIFTFERRTP